MVGAETPRVVQLHENSLGTGHRFDVRNLSVSRGTRVLIRDLNFQLNAREALIVRGANGAGKTTLLRTLAGLVSCDTGTLEWNGVALKPLSESARGLVFFSASASAASGVKDELNALENLRHALAVAGESRREQELLKALARVGLLDQRRIPARLLSQGQRRRIGLAQLTLSERSLWLLDEPSNALDEQGVALLESMVADHLSNDGMAIIATHLPFSQAVQNRYLTLAADGSWSLQSNRAANA